MSWINKARKALGPRKGAAREDILQLLDATTKAAPLCPEDIYLRLHTEGRSSANHPTIYRTLSGLKKAGLVIVEYHTDRRGYYRKARARVAA
jgi:Fe2+ or Zn2+ uptake regulation protein